MEKRNHAENLIFIGIIGLIVGAYLSGSFILSTGRGFSGTSKTLGDDFIEVEDLNATNYYLDDVPINDRLGGDYGALDLVTTGSVNASGIDLNGTYRDTWPTGGGHNHDQDLNTSDDVVFNTVNATTGIELNGTYRTSWPTGGGLNVSVLPWDVIIYDNSTGIYGVNSTSGLIWDSETPDRFDVLINNALLNFSYVYVKRNSGVQYFLNDTDGDRFGIIPRNDTVLYFEPGTYINGSQPTVLTDTFTLLGLRGNVHGALENFILDGGIWDANKGALSDHRGSGTWNANFHYFMGIEFYMNVVNYGRNIEVYHVEVRDVVGFGIDFQVCENPIGQYLTVLNAGDNPITVEGAGTVDFISNANIEYFYVDGGQDVGINTYQIDGVSIRHGFVTNITGFVGASHWGVAIEQSNGVTVDDVTIVAVTGMDALISITGSATSETNVSAGVLVKNCKLYGGSTNVIPIDVVALQARFFDNFIYNGGDCWLYGGTYEGNLFYDVGSIRLSSINDRKVIFRDNEVFSTVIEATGNYGTIDLNRFSGGWDGATGIMNPNGADVIDWWITRNDFINASTSCILLNLGGGTPTNIFVSGNWFKDNTPNWGQGIVYNDNFGLGPTDINDNSTMGEYVLLTAGVDIDFGDALYLATDGDVEPSDANSTATMFVIGISAQDATAGSPVYVLLNGWTRCDDYYAMSVGSSNRIYAGWVPGEITQTAPNSTGDQVQVIGYPLTAQIFRFVEDFTVIEIG